MDGDARKRQDDLEIENLTADDLRGVNHFAQWVARRSGLSSADHDDVWQELALGLWRALSRYDPSRASRATFRESVLKLECLAIARRMRALRRRDARVAEAFRAIARRGISVKGTAERDHMLRSAVASLHERQRQICLGLLAGESVSGVARKLGIHRGTAHRELVAIRPAIRAALTESLD